PAESITIAGSVLVHCRAAAGGGTTKATISTSPTAFTPITVPITMVTNIRVSKQRALKPSTLAGPGSKVRMANSFQHTTITASTTAPTTMLVRSSAQVGTEALPNR